jgi:SAM-dependent methyltransferase
VTRAPSGSPSALPLTGERTLPGLWQENYWFRRHEAAYRLFAADCVGARVVDAGCGEGYGAALLAAAGAATVVALDLDLPTLRHVRSAYPAVVPALGNRGALPVADGSVDVVVSSQTVEHLWDQDGFVRECARVLRPGGRLLMSTPNRRTFPPGNVFHSRELDAAELVALAGAHLGVDAVLGVRHGPRLRDWPGGDPVARQLAGPPEQWDPDLAALVRSVAVADFVVTEDDLDTSLDLIVTGTVR